MSNQFGIGTTLDQQFLGCSAFNDPTTIEYNDAIGLLNRAQSVRDNQGSSAFEERVGCLGE